MFGAKTADAATFGTPIFGAVTKKATENFSLNPLKPFIDDWVAMKEWFFNVPQNVAEFSVGLMANLYELCAKLILTTPLWIFDNQWFQNTTYMFSLSAIGIVSTLTAIEGIKRMLAKVNKKVSKPMDIKEIGKRWFIASGILTAAPWLFQKTFQILNWVSNTLISMGGDTIRSVALPENIPIFDVIVLVLFDAVLITTIIPVLWKNGRRFFDILVLGITTPFAMTAWIFDSYKHLHRQWWERLKHLSMVQVYYALFLLVLGWFIFGVPTPTDFIGMIIKLLVVIGGFARMVEPPRLISKHLDTDGGFDEVTGDAGKALKGTKKNWARTVQLIGGPKKLIAGMLTEKVASPTSKGKTRMARFHSPKPKK